MSKKFIVGAAGSIAGFYLLQKFLLPTGIVPISDGFGLDDIVLGGGAFLIGMTLAHMV